MGRGDSEQQGSQQRAAPAEAAAAPTPDAPAAAAAGAPIPDDPDAVWRLLLGQLWAPPEQQVVSKLLCCSSAMARLVHAVCAGQVHVRIRLQPEGNWYMRQTPPWQQQVTAQGEAYCRWLAKHARLLAALELDLWQEQDQWVAAGLLAAAGMGAATTQSVTPQAATQRAAARAAAAAAAAGPAAGPAAQPQELPLRSLISTRGSNNGSLLDSLTACGQLERLQLVWWNSFGVQPQRLPTAFTALRGLRELSLELKYGTVVLLQALQLGTQLSKLRLDAIHLSAEAMRSLPAASLADWDYRPRRELGQQQPVFDITHLSVLSRLTVQQQLEAGDKLPPSLEQLDLHDPAAMEPLHALSRLQSLTVSFTRGGGRLEQLQDAVAAIGPSLTALDLGVDDTLGVQLLSQRVTPALPLIGLDVLSGRYQHSIAHLGQWTRLERLRLPLADGCDAAQVAAQLKQLTALQHLGLLSREPLQPAVVDCVVGMASLRSLTHWGALADQQRAQLQAAAQLTGLQLTAL